MQRTQTPFLPFSDFPFLLVDDGFLWSSQWKNNRRRLPDEDLSSHLSSIFNQIAEENVMLCSIVESSPKNASRQPTIFQTLTSFRVYRVRKKEK